METESEEYKISREYCEHLLSDFKIQLIMLRALPLPSFGLARNVDKSRMKYELISCNSCSATRGMEEQGVLAQERGTPPPGVRSVDLWEEMRAAGHGMRDTRKYQEAQEQSEQIR